MLDKKKLLKSILKDMESSGGKLEVEVEKESPKFSDESEGEDGFDMALEVAGEDILMALERRDAKKLAVALKSFFEMCRD
jgi:hypothetical protein